MARRRPAPPVRPGFEPAKGFPDPEAPAAPTTTPTHFPGRSGAVCGIFPVPTYAGAYDPVAPTCTFCSQWLAAAQRVTAARHPPPAVVINPPAGAGETEPPPAEGETDHPPPTPRDGPGQARS